MDFESARQYCKNRNWEWSLKLIDQYQKEMEALKAELNEIKKERVFGKSYPKD